LANNRVEVDLCDRVTMFAGSATTTFTVAEDRAAAFVALVDLIDCLSIKED
jgi:hypothetical protein